MVARLHCPQKDPCEDCRRHHALHRTGGVPNRTPRVPRTRIMSTFTAPTANTGSLLGRYPAIQRRATS